LAGRPRGQPNGVWRRHRLAARTPAADHAPFRGRSDTCPGTRAARPVASGEAPAGPGANAARGRRAYAYPEFCPPRGGAQVDQLKISPARHGSTQRPAPRQGSKATARATMAVRPARSPAGPERQHRLAEQAPTTEVPRLLDTLGLIGVSCRTVPGRPSASSRGIGQDGHRRRLVTDGSHRPGLAFKDEGGDRQLGPCRLRSSPRGWCPRPTDPPWRPGRIPP
jgi:hypothetical protein